MANTVSFKVYLMSDELIELEVRRFAISSTETSSFPSFLKRIVEIFPSLTEKSLTLYWKDEEGDHINISSSEELAIALKDMKSELKKIYVKIANEGAKKGENHDVLHPMVFCDECEGGIVGFRYKCIVCSDYDLCSNCEQLALHSEHPMLRIPNPYIFNRSSLHRIIHYLRTFVPAFTEDLKHHSHHRRRHSHDSAGVDSKKKRKCDKHESGPETDDSEGSCHKKHGHSRSKRTSRCAYSQILTDFLGNFDPAYFMGEHFKGEGKKDSNDETVPDLTNVNYLKSVGKTIASLLDPLGIDVDFEIRPKEQEKEGKNTSEPKSQAQASADVPTTSASTSGSPQKKVHFEPTADKLKEKIDEVTKMMANQKVKESPEKDDWVSFEELKRDSENAENGSESSEKVTPKTTEATAPPQESQNLYPTLSPSRVPQNPVIRQALEKMLSMGFTNDGDWLTHLLEAKNGDINQALEVLAPHKST